MNAVIKKVKNKSGIVEMRPITCFECSEEYCNGRTCMDFNYDLYTRIVPKDPTVNKVLVKATSDHQTSDGKRNIKKKSKSFDFGKSKAKKRNRSKSPTKSKRK